MARVVHKATVTMLYGSRVKASLKLGVTPSGGSKAGEFGSGGTIGLVVILTVLLVLADD